MDERTNCSVRFVPFRQRISFNVGFRTEIQQKQASIRPKVEAKKGKKSAGKNIEFLFRYYIPSFPPNENFHVYFGEEKLLHESIGLSTFSWLRFNISRSGTFPPIPPLGVFFQETHRHGKMLPWLRIGKWILLETTWLKWIFRSFKWICLCLCNNDEIYELLRRDTIWYQWCCNRPLYSVILWIIILFIS